MPSLRDALYITHSGLAGTTLLPFLPPLFSSILLACPSLLYTLPSPSTLSTLPRLPNSSLSLTHSSTLSIVVPPPHVFPPTHLSLNYLTPLLPFLFISFCFLYQGRIVWRKKRVSRKGGECESFFYTSTSYDRDCVYRYIE